jgi:hypothetical protein
MRQKKDSTRGVKNSLKILFLNRGENNQIILKI